MYRAAVLFVALMAVPSLASAQQPCTTDANQVVNELYRHMLERSPDAGSAHWVQQLQSGRMTVKQVVREIAASQEHVQRFWQTEAGEETPYVRSVNRLYRHILGRQPDAAGARHWAELGARSGAGAVVDALINSAEYNNAYGDWGVPGSGGIRYCGSNNQGGNTQVSQSQPQQSPIGDMRFRGMDRNADGRVDANEWRGSRRSFEVHDWNNDGMLSGDEVRAGAARVGRTLEDEDFDRAEQFEYLDVNNNNRIELREWHSTAVAFDRLDSNNDNFLTRGEFGGTASASTGFGTTGTAGSFVTVDSRSAWVDTGIDVRRGDVIMFEVDGEVQLSSNANDVAGAGGHISGRRAANAPLGSAPAGALLARIGNQGIVVVGDRRSLRAPSAGRLYLGVNDDHYDDNSGSFRVMVDVRQR
jgi:Ca2+-binding EF-hand superfamily protein